MNKNNKNNKNEENDENNEVFEIKTIGDIVGRLELTEEEKTNFIKNMAENTRKQINMYLVKAALLRIEA